MGIFKKIWRGVSTVEGVHGFLTSSLVWPAIAAVGTLMSGLATSIPLPYLIAAASFVFAAIASGLLRVSELRHKHRVEGTLTFGTMLVGTDVEETADGAVLHAVSFGVQVVNTGALPLEFQVKRFSSSFSNKVPDDSPPPPFIEVAPGGTAWWRDGRINVEEHLPFEPKYGKVEFEFEYWRGDGKSICFPKNIISPHLR